MPESDTILKIYAALDEHFPGFSPLDGRSTFELTIAALIKEGIPWDSVVNALNNLWEFPTPTKLAGQHLDSLRQRFAMCADPKRAALRVKALLPRLMTWGYLPVDYANHPTDELRRIFLSGITGDKGVVDFILLFALDRPIVIADSDVRKILFRINPQDKLKDLDYDELSAALKEILPDNVTDYKRFYLLVSHLTRMHCADKNPACRTCPLVNMCECAGVF